MFFALIPARPCLPSAGLIRVDGGVGEAPTTPLVGEFTHQNLIEERLEVLEVLSL